MKTTNLIIDGSQIIYASAFKFESLTYNKQQTGILHGFFSSLFSFMKIFEAENIIVCWDSRRNIRKGMSLDYKKKRHSTEQPDQKREKLKSFFL